MEPGVLLRVRIAPVGFAPAGDPELVESMARPIHQSAEKGICSVISRGRKGKKRVRVELRLRMIDPPKQSFPA